MSSKLFSKLFYAVAAVAVISAWASSRSSSPPTREPYVIGRNNTVLFMTNIERGLHNVHVATAAELLRQNPLLEVHWASFAPMKKQVARISKYASEVNSNAKEVQWHEIHGTSYLEQVLLGMDNATVITDLGGNPPGMAEASKLAQLAELATLPWNGEAALDLYDQAKQIIVDVDPALVVIDLSFSPVWDATRNLNRSHVIVTPNDPVTLFAHYQSWGAMLWKFPAIGAGVPYPIPLRDIPTNAWLRIRSILPYFTSSRFLTKYNYLLEKGVKSPISALSMLRDDVPFMTMSMAEAGIPIDHLPPNVTECGPIVIDLAPVNQQDPELAAWLRQAPTVLINLGTLLPYDPHQMLSMAKAVNTVLEGTDVQILWKVLKHSPGLKSPLWKPYTEKWTENGRLRLVQWLEADPMSILKSGDIVLSVHHGGASSYYETVLAGLPHLVLPQWVDTYILAAAAEYRGIGIWPSKETSPRWDPEQLAAGFLEALQGPQAESLKTKAKALGEISQGYGGKQCAAGVIANMAAQGV